MTIDQLNGRLAPLIIAVVFFEPLIYLPHCLLCFVGGNICVGLGYME